MPKKYEDLKIYPLKIDEEQKGEINKYPLCDVPHLIVIIGRVKAGKSLIINNLYLSERFYGKDFQIKILISPSAYNDKMNKHLLEDFDYIFTEYSDDLIDVIIEMIEKDESDDKYLIVFDDIVGSGVASKKGKTDKITSLSTLYRHIGNGETEGKLSIVIAIQYFKYLNPILRNQCSGVYICGHYTKKEIEKISESYSFFGGSDEKFIEIYNKSRKEPYDFLFLNVHSMEARRNHDEILWNYNDFIKNGGNDVKQLENKDKDKDEKEEDLFECECGSFIINNKKNLQKHKKTKKHLNFFEK